MTTNNRSFKLIAAVAVAGSMWSSSSQASVAQAVPFDEKVDNAAGIVLGKVVKTESRFDASGRWILTYSTFHVEKSLKGQAPAEVTVVTPGGRVGNVNQSTVGIPAFEQGDERVVFLKDTKLGPTVLYFDQGTYDVAKNDRGDRLIVPVESELVRVDTQTGTATAGEEPRTLSQFEGAVKDAIRTRPQRVEMSAMQQRAQRPSSLADFFARNKLIIAIAAIGAALALWQILKR